MLIDTHAHLNSSDFFTDYKECIKNAKEAGVDKIICVGFDYETNKKAIEIANDNENIYATVGYHPSEAGKITDEDFLLLREYLKEKKVIAIGECGLDFYWVKDNMNMQIYLFKEQIKLAYEFDLPLVIHMRDATEIMLKVLKEEYQRPYKGVMHCYSGSKEAMNEFLKLGFYISFGGPLTFKNARIPKEVAVEVPLNRILIETDSPYLTPHPFRGVRNEPKHVKLVALELANLKNMKLEEIEKITSENAQKLFNI